MTETENKVIKKAHKNMYMPICITQAITVAVILIAVLIIKFFFDGCYSKMQKWYIKNILDETKVTQIFDGEN